MNSLKKYILLIGFCFFCTANIQAQKGLEIETVFNDYGKQEGSMLIELAKDVLGDNTRISKYKSLVTQSTEEIIEVSRRAIDSDIEGGLKLLEIWKDGQIETGHFCLKKDKDSKTYEYILFKNKSKQLTLIYVRGNFPPEQLEKELGKLKNLFIKINNKKIKLSAL